MSTRILENGSTVERKTFQYCNFKLRPYLCNAAISLEFERKQQEIIDLWHACYASLVHRTYFFLLFKGDPADSIYMEVEIRRLYFLKDTYANGGMESKVVAGSLNTSLVSR